MIPGRCVHCGEIMEHIFSSWHQYWGECTDCRAWQQYLWEQHPSQPVLTHTALLEILAEMYNEEGVG